MLGLAIPAQARRPVPLLPIRDPYHFSPDQPHVLGAEHPLFRRILPDRLNMPGRVGSHLHASDPRRRDESGTQEDLGERQYARLNVGRRRTRLRVSWRQFDLPFHIGISSTATVAINYELSRIDNGQVIFSREIRTRASARGGNAATRAQETRRAAILANIASSDSTSEKAAVEQAPEDCAVNPVGSFSAPIAVAVPDYRGQH